jgi:trehalose 6-phosphate synthase/phosphatase
MARESMMVAQASRPGRLLLVANRLPISIRHQRGDVIVTPSTGGLASGLRGIQSISDRTLWFGWTGASRHLDPAAAKALSSRLEELGAVPVDVSPDEIARYYDGFSNGVLWPLFHYLLDKVNLDAGEDWEHYEAVNARFADCVAARYRPGDQIWVHDYQLALVPALLRARLPDAPIGFFLHVPFPSADVFRVLPWREQMLRGMLGADLIGFHTDAYRNHFVSSVAHVLGIDSDRHRIRFGARDVRVGVFPIGVDAGALDALARTPSVSQEVERLRANRGGRKIVLGVDRLDYTKGIPRRLLALERLFERYPSWVGSVRFIQLAIPTRENVPAYAEFQQIVTSLVSRINGRFGGLDDVPVHFLHRSIPLHDLVALYSAADVMMVTPLRDGMNLVAKEYVASHVDDDGVLILSEFAGAAAELSEALLVNPYDLDGVASRLHDALTMPREERTLRMRALREHVAATNVQHWARSFVSSIAPPQSHASIPPSGVPDGVVAQLQTSPSLFVLLDYDGTLVPFARTPQLAAPDRALRTLLARLASQSRVEVHVISGRTRDVLEEWLGALPVGLHAEHGYWSKLPGEEWEATAARSSEWKAPVRAALKAFALRVVGSFLEEKDMSIAWHYRAADPDSLRSEIDSLRQLLARTLREHDVELLDGAKVLEVRARGINKGIVLPRILAPPRGGAQVLAIGDDMTDEDLFRALRSDAITIRVGDGESCARYRVADSRSVRALLEKLVTPPAATVDLLSQLDG